METGVIHPKLSKLCQEDQLKLLVWKVMLVTLENILSMAYHYDLFLLMHFFCMNLTNQDSERWQVNRSHSSSSGCSNSMAMGFGAMRDMKALIFFTTTSYIQLDRTMLKVNRLLTLNFDCSSLTFPSLTWFITIRHHRQSVWRSHGLCVQVWDLAGDPWKMGWHALAKISWEEITLVEFSSVMPCDCTHPC